MKQIGRYNKVSSKFQQELGIKQLKPGERKKFRYQSDRIVIGEDGKKEFAFPETEKLPPTDTIWDPYAQQDPETKGWMGAIVDIGLVNGVDNNGAALPHQIIRRFLRPEPGTGNIYLFGNNEEDRYVYWYMQICNYNAKRAGRDTSKRALFYEVDEAGEAKKSLTRRSQLLEIQNFISSLTGKNLVMTAKAAGREVEGRDEDMIKDDLWAFAEANPDGFDLLRKDNKKIESLSIIKQALESGVLVYDPTQMTVTNTATNNVVATLKRVEGKSIQEQLDEYFKTTTKGEREYETIKKLVTAKAVA